MTRLCSGCDNTNKHDMTSWILRVGLYCSEAWCQIEAFVLTVLLICIQFPSFPDDESFPYKTKSEQRHRVSLSERFTEADLRSLSELNPPALMENGNVGTPVKVFLQLIQACRLPPRLIRKLGLTFPKTSSSRRYGNVPFQYRDTRTLPATEETVLTANGHEISGPGSLATPHSGPRRPAHRTETDEMDEPKDEEDAESNADDVSIKSYCSDLSISVSVTSFIVFPSPGGFCRTTTGARSGSVTRRYTRTSRARSEAKRGCTKRRLS